MLFKVVGTMILHSHHSNTREPSCLDNYYMPWEIIQVRVEVVFIKLSISFCISCISNVKYTWIILIIFLVFM